MLNNPEKTSTAWSELPEPSNQSYFIWKVNIPRLIELSRCLLFIVVSSAKLFRREPEIGTSSWLVLSPVFRGLLFKSPFLQSLYASVIISFTLQGNCSLSLLDFSSERFFAFFSRSERTTRVVLTPYCSIKRQKNK